MAEEEAETVGASRDRDTKEEVLSRYNRSDAQMHSQRPWLQPQDLHVSKSAGVGGLREIDTSSHS